MIDIFYLNLAQAISWTLITFIACTIYKRVGFIQGQRSGRQDAINVFSYYEKDAADRMFNILKHKNREENAKTNYK